ncbi:glycoside hydrolase family 30 protein [Parafilimonas sp.]|uniref:glycoside hydrolase family 30 protein n=1 Tax=Parafilimonas sp. TaxID=1969739 RepID=UPI0039E439BB
MHKKFVLTLVAFVSLTIMNCSKGNGGADNPSSGNDTTATPSAASDVDYWITKKDQSALLQKQSAALSFTSATGTNTITVDSTQTYQTVDGFGYTLTGGSAYVINRNLSADGRSALLKELFGTDDDGIGISYLRISIGASDLSTIVYTYNDMPDGETDINLDHFDMSMEETDFLPVLKEILSINPSIKIIATPWSAPAWMKDNDSSIGGSLKPEYYRVYADYFVKYIQAMQQEGITIDAITPQNEPLNPYNNPSMEMQAEEERDFIKGYLGPAFANAGIATKIVVYDHNCDVPQYPLTILQDAAQYVDGSAFHLYAGDISALSTVHSSYPDKNLYFTEQYTASTGDFGGDLDWHLKNVIIGSMRNWSKIALEWNLANDPNYEPHTTGGCTTCKGALTIGSAITRNVAYYIIAHASKFVPVGSVRISSNIPGPLNNVAFLRPDKKKVLIVENEGSDAQTFSISFKGKTVTTSLPAGAVGTYVW